MGLNLRSWFSTVAAARQRFRHQLRAASSLFLIIALAGCLRPTTGGYIIWTSPKGGTCSYPALTEEEQKTEFFSKFKSLIEAKLSHENTVKKLHEMAPGERPLEYACGQRCIDYESERLTKEEYSREVTICSDLLKRLVLARTKQLSDFDRLVVDGERAIEKEAYTEAADTFLKAMAFNDQDPRVHRGLAEARHRLGQFDQARKEYDLCIKQDPLDWRCSVGFGVTYLGEAVDAPEALALELYKKGLAYFQTLQSRFSDNPRVLHYVGVFARRVGQPQLAYDALHSIIGIEDVDPPINVYAPWNFALAAVDLIPTAPPADAARLCQEALSALETAGRRATKTAHAREPFKQLLRDLSPEHRRALHCNQAGWSRLQEALDRFGFTLPS